jgi:cardiolipin synthase
MWGILSAPIRPLGHRARLARLAGEEVGVTTVSGRILTVPNVLSLVRLLLIPVFLVLLVVGEYGYALLTLVISSVTDFVDGFIARRFNQVSRLGQLLDPAVDRLFIFSTLIGLAWQEVVPWWLVVVIVGRDLLLLVLGIVLANYGYGPLPVHHLGKVATFALLFALPVLVLAVAFPELAPVANPVGWAAAIWGAFLYWWAGIVYLLESIRVVRIPQGTQGGISDTVER